MSLPVDFNGDVALNSLQPPASFPELYAPLWWYSGALASGTSTTSGATLSKGNTSISGGHTLHTLNSSWSSTVKYAFEVSLTINNSANTAYAALWDITSNAIVASSQVSTTSTTVSVIRSGQFTLTPGHQYGVTAWCSTGTVYLTDASLIIFPSAGSVSPSLSSISLANPSGGTLKEAYIPLWVYSSGVTTLAGGAQSLGTYWIRKGTTTPSTTQDSPAKLHTLNSSWSTNQKFAFEASILNGTASDTAYAELWDITANTAVSVSQISVTATTATLVRSGSFTLTPGHTYGVTIGQNAGSCSLTKAHLVALGG